MKFAPQHIPGIGAVVVRYNEDGSRTMHARFPAHRRAKARDMAAFWTRAPGDHGPARTDLTLTTALLDGQGAVYVLQSGGDEI